MVGREHSSSDETPVTDQNVAVSSFDEVSPVPTDVHHYPVPVPMFGVLVLNSHMGPDCDVREGAGVLIVRFLSGVFCGESLSL